MDVVKFTYVLIKGLKIITTNRRDVGINDNYVS